MGGKTRSGLSLTRLGLPPHSPWGRGTKKEETETCSLSLLPKCLVKKQVATRHFREMRRRDLQVPAGKARVAPPPVTSALSGAGRAVRNPGLRPGGARRAHACRGRALPAPFLSAFASPPHVPQPPPQSFPAPSPLSGRWPILPID